MTRSVLDDLGEEITGIVAPVSICMALVVVLVKALNPEGMADTSSVAIATIAYQEKDSDSAGQKLGGALLNALIFMAVIGGMTFVLFLLFKWGCYKVIYAYMGFAMFNVFFFLTGALIIQLLRLSGVHMDLVSFSFLLFNFSVVGILALFFLPVPLFLKQCYTVWVGICVAYIFTHVPEWTSWVLLVIMALYDLAAVLLPGGPLKILVELAIERQQELPALVYEARPTQGPYQRGMWRNRQPQQQQQQDGQPTAEAAAGLPGDATTAARGSSSSLISPAAGTTAGGSGAVASLAAVLGAVRRGSVDNGDGDGSPSHRVALLAGQGRSSVDSMCQEMARTPRGSSSSGGASAGATVGGGGVGEAGGRSARSSRGGGPVAEAREGPSSSSGGAVGGIASSARIIGGGGPVGEAREGTNSSNSRSEQPQAAADVAGQASFSAGFSLSAGTGLDPAAAVPTNAGAVTGAATTVTVVGARDGVHPPQQGPLLEEEYEESEGSVGLPDAIKLGLGDFIFYSMLVGRAAMYDMMTVFTSYLAVIAGLVITLLMLALARKALPALPVSIALGVLFYFLTRLVVEPVVVPMSLNLTYF